MLLFRKFPHVIGIFLLLTFIFFFMRLTNIMDLPMFTDEAIYTRWSQIAKDDANWRFISLTDGKQPSFVWATMILMKFVDDPLFAGRLVSTISGFFAMVGLFFLGSEVFKKRSEKGGYELFGFTKRTVTIGLIASTLYVFFPFALVYDRMALYDSLVACFAVWALYFQILLVRYIRLDLALILGAVMGVGVLTKTNAFFSIYLFPFLGLLIDWKRKGLKERVVRWVAYGGVAIVIAYVMYGVLRLSPFFHIIEEKNAIFVYPLNEWLEHPFRFVFGNLRGLFDWLITYLTIPGFLLVLASFILGRFAFWREKLLLLIWFLAPFVALALFGKTLYPRFIFFMTMPLLILAAYSLYELLDRIKRPVYRAFLGVLVLALMIRADFLIITNFAHAPIPFSDTTQFINGWPAGGGVREAIAFFQEEAQGKKIHIATQGTFGLMPYAFEIYLSQNPNITVSGIWPINDIPQDLIEKEEKVYVVYYQPCPSCPYPGEAPEAWPLKLIERYQKGISDHYLSIYEVIK